MDFKRFKDSAFLHLGHSRFDYQDGFKFIQRDTVLFDTLPVTPYSPFEFDLLDESLHFSGGFANAITLVHLRKALFVNDPVFLDFEIKKEIMRQWIEVTKVTNSLDIKPNNSMLLINEPGVVIPKHIHAGRKQTITFCYTFEEEKANVFDDSCFILGEQGERQVNFPKSDKCYFTLKDEIPHEVRSNEWRFFWFNDYDEYVSLPKETDIPFTYLPI